MIVYLDKLERLTKRFENMKYIIGSLIISFGIILVAVIVMIGMSLKAPDGALQYFAIAWGLLAVAVYPFSKKIIREE